jgi:hypothetical protein
MYIIQQMNAEKALAILLSSRAFINHKNEGMRYLMKNCQSLGEKYLLLRFPKCPTKMPKER